MLVADFEVFSQDWVLVAFDLVNETEIIIHNDREQLERLYQEKKDQVWVFYNGRNYDQYIFKAILCGFDPKEVNDFIIVDKRKGYEYSRMFNRVPLNIFDIMPNPPVGLKTLEGFMGSDIRETTVPFDINRKLSLKELSEVIFYCKHDVEQTCEVLSRRIEEYTSQLELLQMFDLPLSDMGKTKAQLSAKILGAVKPSNEREDDIEFCIPKTLRLKKYQFVVDWFLKVQDHARNYKEKWGLEPALDELYSQKLECEIAGVPHVFAFGGIHGAIPNYQGEGYFLNVDVASYYPTLMIEYGYESRNIRDPKKYGDIYRTRLNYKAKKDKRANPLKICLNGTFGAMKDKFNELHDPLMANNVCVSGQLLLLMLIERLEDHCDIIQSNTDGILVKLRCKEDREFIESICHDWEKQTKMTLEFDEYVKVVQRDVNSYLIVDEHGEIKSKGGVVKKLHDLDYDLPIVNRAVVDYLIRGIPVERTVNECTDLRDFQKIYKISGKYLHAVHNGQKLDGKVFRVFASKNTADTALFKAKDKGDRGIVNEKFANCPDSCFIDNDHVKGKPLPEKLDKLWYITEVKKRIDAFLNGK